MLKVVISVFRQLLMSVSQKGEKDPWVKPVPDINT